MGSPAELAARNDRRRSHGEKGEETMRNAKGLLKAAGLFGLLFTATHLAHYSNAKTAMRKQKKRAKKQKKEWEKKMTAAQKQMEELHANPPVRIPVPPNTRN